MFKPDNFQQQKKNDKTGFLEKMKSSSIGGTARALGLGAGLLFGQTGFAQSAEKVLINEQPIENTSANKSIKPEDYDLSKISDLNLRDLKEKKSLNEDALKQIMLESLATTKAFNLAHNLVPDLEVASGQSIPTKSEEEEYLKLAPELFSAIESARQEVKQIIGSSGYLTKLQQEFGCSLTEAKKHQETRLTNLELTNYALTSRNEVIDIYQKEFHDSSDFSQVVLAYASIRNNMIYFPYDYDFNACVRADQDKYQFDVSKHNLHNVARHEFLHRATNSNQGLSPKATKLLEQSFLSNTGNQEINKLYNKYFSIPTERYVRLKILEINLAELGVKNIGEEFTHEHFDKMMELYKNKKLGDDAVEFIEHTMYPERAAEAGNPKVLTDEYEEKFQIYKELFDEIAAADNDQPQQNPLNPAGNDKTKNKA